MSVSDNWRDQRVSYVQVIANKLNICLTAFIKVFTASSLLISNTRYLNRFIYVYGVVNKA